MSIETSELHSHYASNLNTLPAKTEKNITPKELYRLIEFINSINPNDININSLQFLKSSEKAQKILIEIKKLLTDNNFTTEIKKNLKESAKLETNLKDFLELTDEDVTDIFSILNPQIRKVSDIKLKSKNSFKFKEQYQIEQILKLLGDRGNKEIAESASDELKKNIFGKFDFDKISFLELELVETSKVNFSNIYKFFRMITDFKNGSHKAENQENRFYSILETERLDKLRNLGSLENILNHFLENNNEFQETCFRVIYPYLDKELLANGEFGYASYNEIENYKLSLKNIESKILLIKSKTYKNPEKKQDLMTTKAENNNNGIYGYLAGLYCVGFFDEK